MENFPPIEILF